MDVNQFQQLVQGFAQQEAHRTQTEQVRRYSNRVNTCDGSSPANTRQWVREVNLTIGIVGQDEAHRVVTNTIAGPLMFEVEIFFTQYQADNHVARDAVPWAAIRTHVTAQFISQNEPDVLRDSLETLRQSSYETEAAYTRRFKDLASVAFPPAQRNPDQHTTMIRAYIRGLACEQTAQQVIQMNDPDTLDATVQAVQLITSRREKFKRVRQPEVRKEEPMEIGATQKIPAKNPHTDLATLTAAVSSLCASMEKQATKLAKLEDQSRRPYITERAGSRAQADYSRQPAWNTDGQPRCYNCNKYGHKAVDCPKPNSRRRGDLN